MLFRSKEVGSWGCAARRGLIREETKHDSIQLAIAIVLAIDRRKRRERGGGNPFSEENSGGVRRVLVHRGTMQASGKD